MPTSEELNILALMRENAALCNLEAEVIIALKANGVEDGALVEQQIVRICECLNKIDEVRRRNDEATKSQALREE
jgi:hypothetical protein